MVVLVGCNRFHNGNDDQVESQSFLRPIQSISYIISDSVKMVGLFVVATIGVCVLVDLWDLMDIKRGLTMVSYCTLIIEKSRVLIDPRYRNIS